MIETKYFNFVGGPVQTASDPSNTVDIPPGTHLVIFDDMVSKKDGDDECEVRWAGTSLRIERTVLETLCKDDQARFVRDA